MSSVLNSLTTQVLEPRINEAKIREALEKLLYLIKRNNGSRVRLVSPALAKAFTGDFYGLIQSLGIEPKYQWITMRLNNLYCSSDFSGEVTAILIPNTMLVDKIVNSIRMQ